jgi:hypothetical protein
MGTMHSTHNTQNKKWVLRSTGPVLHSTSQDSQIYTMLYPSSKTRSHLSTYRLVDDGPSDLANGLLRSFNFNALS